MKAKNDTSQLVTAPLSDQLLQILSDRIVNLSYPLGAKIDVESIKDEYGVSHIPVRDALHKLAEQGLVVVVPRIGYFTAKFSQDEIEELCDIRELVEVYAIGRSVNQIDKGILRTLRKWYIESKGLEVGTEEDAKHFFDLAERLHREVIVGHAGSALIQKIYTDLQNKIRMASRMRYLRPVHSGGVIELPPEDTEEHVAIIDALIKEDKVAAKRTLRAHLKAVRKRILSGTGAAETAKTASE